MSKDFKVKNGLQVTTNITASGDISGSGTTTLNALTLKGLSTQGSETTAVMINGSNVVGTRDLGSNAFTSTTIGTTTNALTAGDGLTSAGTFTGATARTFSVNSASMGGFYSGSMNDFTTTGTGSFGAVTSTGTISSSGTIVGNELQDTSLTSGRVTFATTDGVLTDSSILTFNGVTLASTIFNASRGATINETGHSTGDFRVEGSGNTNLLFTDASEDTVGINMALPTASLDITGDLRVSSHITSSGNISASGDLIASDMTLDGTITHTGDTNTKLVFTDDNIALHAGDDDLSLNLTQTVFRPGTNQEMSLGFDGKEWKEVVTQHITASGNISSSGTMTMLTASIGGGIFTSASLAAGGGGGGGSMNNFTLAGDGGDNQTIADGNTLTIAGGDGITTTGADTDTVSIAVDASQDGHISSILTTDLKLGEDAQTKIDFETVDEIHFDVNNVELLNLSASLISGSAISTGSFGRVEASTVGGLTSLESDGGNILLKDGATTRADIDISSAQVVISSSTSTMTLHGTNIILDGKNDIQLIAPDKDITFKTDASTNVFHFNLEDSPELEVSPANMGESFIIDVQGDIALEAVGKDISLGSGTGTQEFIFNCEDAPELDVDGDFTIDGSGLIKLDSATDNIDLIGNVTASGNISSSGIITDKLNVNPKNPTSPNMDFGAWNIGYGSTGTEFTGSLPSAGNGYGEIVHFGDGATLAGRIYCLKSDFTWELAGANGPVSSSLLAVAMGTHASASGMLLRGVVYSNAHDSLVRGQKVYNEAGGRVANVAGSDAGDVVRVLGYCVGQSAHIYFNPDNTWVEHS